MIEAAAHVVHHQSDVDVRQVDVHDHVLCREVAAHVANVLHLYHKQGSTEYAVRRAITDTVESACTV